MAANGARKVRVGAFGIALCFLAALFFVEAKTTWAVVGNETSTAISSSKVQPIDPSQKVDVESELGHLSDRALTPLIDVLATLLACTLACPPRRIQTLFEYVPLHVYDGSGQERSVRPPPSR